MVDIRRTCAGDGSEFVAHQVKKWLLEHGIGAHYIDPVSSWQNPILVTQMDRCTEFTGGIFTNSKIS